VVARGIKGSKLFQVNVLFSAAGGLYYPAIPLFLRGINISIDETSLLLSSLSLSSFISAVIWGRVADSPQRRGRIITVTTLGGAALYMALALPLPLVAFVVILLVSSLMLSGLMPTVMAEASGWVNAIDEFSYFWIGGSLGYAITTAFTGYVLGRFGIRLIFLLSSLLILGVYVLARGLVNNDSHGVVVNAGNVMQDNVRIPSVFWLLTVAVIIFLFTDVAKNLYIPVFYAFDLRMGDALATLTLSIEAFLEIPVIYAFTRVLKSTNAWMIFDLSLVLAGLYFIINALIPPNPLLAFIAMATYSLVWGTYSVSSSALVSRLTGLGRRGTAYGIYNAAFPIANVIGPLYIGYIISSSGYRHGLMYLSMPPLLMGLALLGAFKFTGNESVKTGA